MSTVNRSLRINKEFDDALKKEAEKCGISLNSFINLILDKYITTYKLIETFPLLILPHELIKRSLERLTEEFIFELGTSAGSYIPKHGLFLNGMTPKLENILWVMEKRVSRDSNWYQFQSLKNDGKLNLLLRHNLGRKWSVFLNAYYSALFKELLNMSIKTNIGKNSLEIILPKTIKLNNIKNTNNSNQYKKIKIPMNNV